MPNTFADGIEWFSTPHGEDCRCARCGAACTWIDCSNCEDDLSHHDCGEDCCCCPHPENNVRCDWCRGTGGSWHCLLSPEWCNAHPMPGREHVPSTALNAEAWRDL